MTVITVPPLKGMSFNVSSPLARWLVTELPVILILAAVAGLSALSFFSDEIVGFSDSIFYRTFAMDNIIQARNGVFPIYTGATEFNVAGYPSFTWVGFFYFMILVDILSGRGEAPTLIFNQSMVIFAFLNVFVPYICLRALTVRSRVASAVGATLFALCPGCLGALYVSDYYPTFAANSVVFAACALLAYSVNQYSRRASIALGLCLTVLWMVHAPTAILVMACVFLFWLVATLTAPSRLLVQARSAATTVITFAITSAWFFWSIKTMKMVSQHSHNEDEGPHLFLSNDFHEQALNTARAVFPVAMLPIDIAKSPYGAYQLGYSLWLLAALTFAVMVFVGVGGALGRRGTRGMGRGPARALTPLAAGFLFLLALTIPVPVVSDHVLTWLPGPFSIVTDCFYFRTYRILAALTCVGAVIAWCRWRTRRARPIVALLLIPAVLAWSAWEAGKLIQYGFKERRSAAESARVFDPDSALTTTYSFMSVIDDINGTQHLDPILMDSVDDGRGGPILGNAAHLVGTCSDPAATLPMTVGCPGNRCDFESSAFDGPPVTLASFTVPKGQRAAFILAVAGDPTMRIRPPELQVLVNGELYSSLWTIASKRYVLPVLASKRDENTVTVVATIHGEKGRVTLSDACAIRYDHAELPIRPLSGPPHSVAITLETSGSYISHLTYFEGLAATNNGVKVTASPSPNNYATIPLHAGYNEVTLAYTGTRAMTVLLVVSALGMLGSLLLLSRGRVRRP